MFSATKIIFTFFSAAILVATFMSGSSAQGLKIGYIDDEKVKQGYPEWARAAEQWSLEQKVWDEEAASKQQELRDLMDEYEKQKLILSEDKRREREATIRAKNDALDAFTRQIFGPGGRAEQKQMELIGPLLENVDNAIEAVALEGNFDVIFTSMSGIGYINPVHEVTDEVLAQLDKLER